MRRARVLDDPGRSPHIELDLERSFDDALSRQSVYEQTGRVVRHTESVQDDKVQKQDWKQSSSSHRPPVHAVAAAGADSKDA